MTAADVTISAMFMCMHVVNLVVCVVQCLLDALRCSMNVYISFLIFALAMSRANFKDFMYQ